MRFITLFILLLLSSGIPISSEIVDEYQLFDDQIDSIWFKLKLRILDADFDEQKDSIQILYSVSKSSNDTEIRFFDWIFQAYHSDNASVDDLIQTGGDSASLDASSGSGSGDLVHAKSPGNYKIIFSLGPNSVNETISWSESGFSVFNETKREIYIEDNNLEDEYIWDVDFYHDFTINVPRETESSEINEFINTNETEETNDGSIKLVSGLSFLSISQFMVLVFVTVVIITLAINRSKK